MLGRINGKQVSTLIAKDNFMCLFILIKKNMTHLPLAFNNNPAKLQKQVLFQKHLGVYLYGRLEFVENLQSMFKKVKKTIDLIRKLQNNISRAPLLITFKWFTRPY